MSGHCLTPLPLPWKTNVMGLLGECRILLVSILCPPVAYYVTSEAFEQPPAGIVESCIGGYCLCCGFLLRTRLRDKYNLDGSLLGDFLTHCCCHCVALARIWREAEVQSEAEMQQQQQMQMHNNAGQNSSLVPMQSLSLPQQMPQHIPPPQQQHFMPAGLQQMGYVHPYQPSPMYMPMPQPAVMMRPMGNVLGQVAEPVVMDQRNTIDTNLSSDFESRNDTLGLRQDTGSCVRNNSMDPPPSNTDPDPWGMLPAPQSSPAFPAPPVGMNQPELKAQHSHPAEKKTEQVHQDQCPPTRLSYEAFVANELADVVTDDRNRPYVIGQIKEEAEPKKDLMTKRLAGLRPPNQPLHPAESEASTAKKATDAGAMADQVMLGGMDYVKILSIAPGDADLSLQAENSQEDPPQHQAVDSRVGSGESKNGDGSFLTQGGIAGSEHHGMSLNEFSADTPRQ